MKPLLKPRSLHHTIAPKVLALTAAALFCQPLWAQGTATLQDGTRIRLEVLNELSSNKSRAGQEVKLRVRDDVMGSKQEVLIRKGAPAFGRVTRAKGSGGLGRSGKLEFVIDTVQAIDGSKVPLRSEQTVSGRKRFAEVGAAAVLVTPLALFVKGRNATIKSGTVLETYINEDATIQVGANAAPDADDAAFSRALPNPTTPREVDVIGGEEIEVAEVQAPEAQMPEAQTPEAQAAPGEAGTVVVTLSNGRREAGVLTQIDDKQVGLQTDIGLLQIDAAKITSIVAQQGEGRPQPMRLKLRNGKEVQGTLDTYQNGAYVMQTDVGSVTVKKENVVSLSPLISRAEEGEAPAAG